MPLEESHAPRRVAVHASTAVTETIRAGLRGTGLEIRPLLEWASDIETATERVLDLLVCEEQSGISGALRAALGTPALAGVPVIVMGKPNEALLRPDRPALHQLPRDAPIADVLLHAREILFGEPVSEAVPPSLPAAPSAPLSVLPRRPDHGTQGPPALRSPASLLPAPNQHSSSPPRRRSVPVPPSGQGRLIDEVDAAPQQLSRGLLEVLGSAEQRARAELNNGHAVERAVMSSEPLSLSDDLAAALAVPIGEYGAQEPTGQKAASSHEQAALPAYSLEPHRQSGDASVPKTEARPTPPAEDVTEAPPSSRLDAGTKADASAPQHAPPPQRERTREMLDTGIEVVPDAAGSQEDAQAPDRRPTATTSAGGLTSPLPKDPRIPNDSWVRGAIRESATTLDPRGGSLDGVAPQTSRSGAPAQNAPSQANNSEAKTTPPSTTAGFERDEARVSTLPPAGSQAPSTVLLDAETVDAPKTGTRAEQEPTTRPPRPSADAAEPQSDGHPAESAAVELREGQAVSILAGAISRRFSGAFTIEANRGIRRIVLRDGDLVTAASSLAVESLANYLIETGRLSAETGAKFGHRAPGFGRHAGAALIASGHLPQDQLWPTLRAHAEFIAGNAVIQARGVAALEETVPERLQAEPSVFGGATGSEVFVDIVRKVVPPDTAVARLGGEHVRFKSGARQALLDECALQNEELETLHLLRDHEFGDALGSAPSEEFPCVVYALTELGVLSVASRRPPKAAERSKHETDPLDDEAVRQAVQARRTLVEDGDYFAVLGVPRSATGYHIRRAFLTLRRSFEPSVILSATTLDLDEDVASILEVLEEAYEVLKDPRRRERYRAALEATPPGPRN